MSCLFLSKFLFQVSDLISVRQRAEEYMDSCNNATYFLDLAPCPPPTKFRLLCVQIYQQTLLVLKGRIYYIDVFHICLYIQECNVTNSSIFVRQFPSLIVGNLPQLSDLYLPPPFPLQSKLHQRQFYQTTPLA
jgi:hypothetical protein